MNRRVFLIALSPVLALGAWLRLADLAGPSLWLDEILHLHTTRALVELPWYSFLTGASQVGGGTENGALYYALQAFGQTLAPGDVGVRLLPALVGTATLPLMALVGLRIGGRATALAATFLLAVSPLHVYFSREGRPYALLAALALGLLFVLVTQRNRTAVALSWILSIGGAYVGIHCVPLLLSFLAIAGLRWLATRRQRASSSVVGSGARWLHCGAAACLGLILAGGLYLTRSDHNLPDLPIGESIAGEDAGGTPTEYETVLSKRNARRYVNSMTVAGFPSARLRARTWLLLGLALLGGLSPFARRLRVARFDTVLPILGMFVLPSVLSVASLLAVERWYEVRYTSPALPAFLLLAALGATLLGRALAGGLESVALSRGQGRLPEAPEPADAAAAEATRTILAGRAREGAIATALAVLVVLAVAGPGMATARSDPYRKIDWRGVAELVDGLLIEGEPILVPNDWPKVCLDHYLRARGREVEFVKIWERSDIGRAAVADRSTAWLLTAGFQKSNDARSWMFRFDPVLRQRHEALALFFYPDFRTLLETRSAADRLDVLFDRFAQQGGSFEFSGDELLLLGEGWSYPEDDGAGTDFQWAVGGRAELALPVEAPRDARVRFRANAFDSPTAAEQRVEVWLNDVLLGARGLPPGEWTEHEVEAPASVWRSGANLLELRFSVSTRPIRVVPGSRDRRPLNAALDLLEVLPRAPSPE